MLFDMILTACPKSLVSALNKDSVVSYFINHKAAFRKRDSFVDKCWWIRNNEHPCPTKSASFDCDVTKLKESYYYIGANPATPKNMHQYITPIHQDYKHNIMQQGKLRVYNVHTRLSTLSRILNHGHLVVNRFVADGQYAELARSGRIASWILSRSKSALSTDGKSPMRLILEDLERLKAQDRLLIWSY